MKRRFRHVAILTVVLGCGPVFALLFPKQELNGLPVSAAEWRLADQAVLKPVPVELKNFRSGEWARKGLAGSLSWREADDCNCVRDASRGI